MKRQAQPCTSDAAATLAQDVASMLGGRVSAELGIDVDAGDAEVERWFLAATLFGTRVSAAVAERAFKTLAEAGLARIGQARHVPSRDLIALLDAAGYARYDFRMSERLLALSEVIDERYEGQVPLIGRTYETYPALRTALLALPGWGPATVDMFLRELRGVWSGARPPLDQRAASGARHLGILAPGEPGADPLARLAELAARAALDARDLEGGLVRLALAHRHLRRRCPGGQRCVILHRAAQVPGLSAQAG
jgi:hypothetical protein